MAKFEFKGLKELQRELERLKREARSLRGSHSVTELRQKLKKFGLKDTDVESFLADLPRQGATIDDNLIRTLAKHNTAEQFEAEIRKNNPQASEEEIQEAIEKFRHAQQEHNTKQNK
jgi:hypothetical protein